MTRDEWQRILPNASESFLRANASDHPAARSGTSDTVPQRPVQPDPLAAPQAKARDSGSYTVRFTSFRSRLLDEDNLCCKFHCDALRYAGILPDDSPDITHIETRQIKCPKKEQRTEIAITRISK